MKEEKAQRGRWEGAETHKEKNPIMESKKMELDKKEQNVNTKSNILKQWKKKKKILTHPQTSEEEGKRKKESKNHSSIYLRV